MTQTLIFLERLIWYQVPLKKDKSDITEVIDEDGRETLVLIGGITLDLDYEDRGGGLELVHRNTFT